LSASQEISHVLWNTKFITSFTTARQLSYPEPDESSPPLHSAY